jgi:hypothetical protein
MTSYFSGFVDFVGAHPHYVRIPMKSPGHSEMMSPGIPT